MKTGVYFLIKRRSIVYIGSTTIFPIRFNGTNREFDFDRIRLIECAPDVLLSYEKRWIKLFMPKYNIVYSKIPGSMSGKRNPNGGNKKGNTRYKKLKRGEVVAHDKNYHPSALVKGYNNSFSGTRIMKFFKEEDKYFLKRVK